MLVTVCDCVLVHLFHFFPLCLCACVPFCMALHLRIRPSVCHLSVFAALCVVGAGAGQRIAAYGGGPDQALFSRNASAVADTRGTETETKTETETETETERL